MNNKDFQRLMTGVRQMKEVLSGKGKPARETSVTQVRRSRLKLKLTQKEFAHMLGISLATLRNWEQGRVQPDGPARALLTIVEKRPDAVLEALHAS